jgi:D-sedoheptulose 7-phosphate isomerase
LNERLDRELADHIEALRGVVTGSAAVIDEIAAGIAACFAAGGKVLVCGNGGSAADAQHFVAEFMNRLRVDHAPWPAIALSTDTSVLTSIANDADYGDVFARQVDALGRPGDVLIAMSTSGSSANVLAALTAGRRRGMVTVGFTGEAGAGPMAASCDLVLSVPSNDTARIQEAHEFVYHYIAADVETRMLEPTRATAAEDPTEDGRP